MGVLDKIKVFKKHRPMSSTARILSLLTNNGHATNRELNKICFNYNQRICELRKEGHIIVANRLTRSKYDYVYKDKAGA